MVHTIKRARTSWDQMLPSSEPLRNDGVGRTITIRHTLEQGTAQTACPRTAGTCTQILKSWILLWTFLHHADVAPTNNDAERALRAIVVKRKISGPTRSRRGDLFIARGFSVIETCRRLGRDAFEYLQQAVTAWLHNVPAPSLVPAAVPTG